MSVPIIGESRNQPLSSEPPLPEVDEATKERLAAMGEQAGVDPKDELPVVATAFLVVLGPNGEYSATHDLDDVNKFRTQRPAGGDDIIAGCAVVGTSMAAQQTAVLTQQIMMQSAAMMAKKQQEAQMMQGIDPSKLRV